MLNVCQILVRVIVLATSAVALGGCGQKGPLVLPSGTAAAGRATLPETLRSGTQASPPTPAAPASAPATR
ncbi:MAG: LPS translocon maturation chaperone LptM [Burkholderiaceae bacterium]